MHITLAFRKANRHWLSRLVAKITKSDYDHSEIIIGTVWVGAHFKGGVTTRRVEYPLHAHWDYIDVPIDPAYKELGAKFINRVRGSKYDYVGAIVGEGLNLPKFNIFNRYFCSELVVSVTQQFHSKEVEGVNPVSISPQELYDLYKGYLDE